MKSLVFISLLLLLGGISCTERKSDKTNHKREDVIGQWQAKDGLPDAAEGLNISGFKLLSDSSVVVSFSNSKDINGTWRWKSNYTVGNKLLSVGAESDILLTYMESEDMASVYVLTCVDKNDKLFLEGNGITFKR